MATLSTLVSELDAELQRLGYKDPTLVWYRACWRRLGRCVVGPPGRRMPKHHVVERVGIRQDRIEGCVWCDVRGERRVRAPRVRAAEQPDAVRVRGQWPDLHLDRQRLTVAHARSMLRSTHAV